MVKRTGKSKGPGPGIKEFQLSQLEPASQRIHRTITVARLLFLKGCINGKIR